jgi:hypothetical protein
MSFLRSLTNQADAKRESDRQERERRDRERLTAFQAKIAEEIETGLDHKKMIETASRGEYEMVVLNREYPGKDCYNILQVMDTLQEQFAQYNLKFQGDAGSYVHGYISCNIKTNWFTDK